MNLQESGVATLWIRRKLQRPHYFSGSWIQRLEVPITRPNDVKVAAIRSQYVARDLFGPNLLTGSPGKREDRVPAIRNQGNCIPSQGRRPIWPRAWKVAPSCGIRIKRDVRNTFGSASDDCPILT